MIPSETQAMNMNNYFNQDNNPSIFPANFRFIHTNLPPFHFSTFLSANNLQTSLSIPDLAPNSSCISNNSTSDDAEEHQVMSIIDERKQRRMISNRESARRSRMRKQRHLDELWSQVLRLRTANHNLIDRLNHVSESHDKVVQENVRLKEEASDLRRMLTDLQVNSSYSTVLRDLEQIPGGDTARLPPESPDPSSTNLLN
ncbi:Basic leucine zipper 43 [Sesamum alatum]|uniref:Basic leucine zipper 43 n=1 Tax=Sesamum alatum TaxID=300844 RepID=A0AAE2CIR0_9LAMI|nr:Basic leucine zipper 43 [Sesamum alatum]